MKYPKKRGQRAVSAENRTKTWKLYKNGVPWRRIAEEVGISMDTIRRYINSDLEELGRQRKEIGEKVLDAELERLDNMLETYTPLAINGDKEASALVLKFMNRRARYLGLDAPEKQEISFEDELSSVLKRKAKIEKRSS